MISFANSITNQEIGEALASCKIKNNIYYVYLLRGDERREIWNSIIDKLAKERKMFRLDPKCKQYRRDKNTVRHLEKFLKNKSKQYYSRAEPPNYKVRISHFKVDL